MAHRTSAERPPTAEDDVVLPTIPPEANEAARVILAAAVWWEASHRLRLAAPMSPDTLLIATTTMSLATDVGGATDRPYLMVGAHCFLPSRVPPRYQRGTSGKEANEGGNERTAFERISRLGVRYWQRRPLFLHLFNDKAQYQK